MKPSQNKDVVEGGCNKCNQRFYCPIDEDGNPIWTHTCPPSTDEKLDRVTELLEQLTKEKTIGKS